jgi:7-cyano-7-deazaguanine synthase
MPLAKTLKKSVVLVSGGLDSAVTAAVAKAAGRVAFMHANYGQRTETRELKAFSAIADHYGVKERLVVDLGFLRDIGGSALTDKTIAVPKGLPKAKKTPMVPVTYVPFRNAILLSIATSWAEAIGAMAVYIGAVEEDSSGYPDCRKKFIDGFNRVVALGTRPETRIRIKSPLIRLRKSAIVKKGVKLKAPLHLTWSCYTDSELACGECESCFLRLRGFEEAGESDPISYKRR